MKKTYKTGCLAGHTYDFGNLSEYQIWELENAMSINALEGFDNQKINQQIIDEEKQGLSTEESIAKFTEALKKDLKGTLAKYK